LKSAQVFYPKGAKLTLFLHF